MVSLDDVENQMSELLQDLDLLMDATQTEDPDSSISTLPEPRKHTPSISF
eukprot:m.146224 g.146224  ORF g.146224 m.146224 type:complete len:50 (+) comp24305_c0_seq2:460-609(+)